MRARPSIYFFAVALFPLLFFLQNPRVTEPVHMATLTVLKPVLALGQGAVQGMRGAQASLTNFWMTFKDQSETAARLQELENEVLRIDEMAKENERLRGLLRFSETIPSKWTAARVIGWDPSPWRQTILLGKGTREGIHKDMAVTVPEGLVGRVFEDGPETARVILLTDPDSRVSAMASESRSQGVVGGNGSSSLQMQYLDLDSGVAVGEVVLSTEVGGLFPKGLRIGKIVSVERDPDGLHLLAKVEPFVNFTKLEEVLCLARSR